MGSDHQSGAVTVSVIGAESVPVSAASEAIASSPADLKLQGYVLYNNGGYTVLHALIDALASNSAEFTCEKGILTPTINISETVGSGAGWICEINGKVVTDYANTLINGGDSVVFYYNPATSDTMCHAWFTSTDVSVAKDGSTSLTLMSTPVNNDGTAPTALSGATVYIDGASWGTTDSSGVIPLSSLTSLSLGDHTVTAQKTDSNGKNTLTFARAVLTVTKASGISTDSGKVTVTFRLVGDTVHTAAYNGYINWIKTKSYTLDKDSTVEALFNKALSDAGMSHDDSSDNYISWICAPSILGNYKLSEFSNGNKSGWMYTVNGSHPNLGLCEYKLSGGDEVIWHYVNDYTLETGSDGGGNSQYVNPWLKAADVDPYAGMLDESKTDASNSQIPSSSSSTSVQRPAPR